jgi:hypothetical protein
MGTDNTQDGAEPSPASDGSQPVAWAVVYPNDEVGVIAFRMADANERATASDRVVPLYRTQQTCPYVVGRTTQHCSLTPLSHNERAELQSEIDSLRLAIRLLADHDATLSVQGGNVTVTMDGTLTDEEREALGDVIDELRHQDNPNDQWVAARLQGLLDRLG